MVTFMYGMAQFGLMLAQSWVHKVIQAFQDLAGTQAFQELMVNRALVASMDNQAFQDSRAKSVLQV